MKYQNYNTPLLFVLGFVLLVSCGEKDGLSGGDETPYLTGEFIGTLNGEEWNSNMEIEYDNCLNISITDWQLKTWGVVATVHLEDYKLGRQDLAEFSAMPDCKDAEDYPGINFFPDLFIIQFDTDPGYPLFHLDTITDPEDWGFVDIEKLTDKKIKGSLRLPFINYAMDSIPVKPPFEDRIVLEGEFSAKL